MSRWEDEEKLRRDSRALERIMEAGARSRAFSNRDPDLLVTIEVDPHAIKVRVSRKGWATEKLIPWDDLRDSDLNLIDAEMDRLVAMIRTREADLDGKSA